MRTLFTLWWTKLIVAVLKWLVLSNSMNWFQSQFSRHLWNNRVRVIYSLLHYWFVYFSIGWNDTDFSAKWSGNVLAPMWKNNFGGCYLKMLLGHWFSLAKDFTQLAVSHFLNKTVKDQWHRNCWGNFFI